MGVLGFVVVVMIVVVRVIMVVIVVRVIVVRVIVVMRVGVIVRMGLVFERLGVAATAYAAHYATSNCLIRICWPSRICS